MESTQSRPYALFMLGLSLLSLLGLAIASSGGLTAEGTIILQVADFVVCIFFFMDFVSSMYYAPNRLRYFFKWGWLDLLSSIPMVDAFRIARLARIFRIIRLIRAVRATKLLAESILRRRAEGAFLALGLLSMLLIVVASILILQFETLPASNIKNAEDALWWSITTITTVGYGDRFPLTSEGRLVASLLMICGVGLLGTLSGLIASWFLRPAERVTENELADLIAEVRELRAAIGRQSKNAGIE